MGDGTYKSTLAVTMKCLRGSRTRKEASIDAAVPASTWYKIEQKVQSPRSNTFAKIASGLDLSAQELELLVLSLSAIGDLRERLDDLELRLRVVSERVVSAPSKRSPASRWSSQSS